MIGDPKRPVYAMLLEVTAPEGIEEDLDTTYVAIPV